MFNVTKVFFHEARWMASRQGLKIRGVFQTQEEAEMKCKKLREIDPNHDIYVGPVGMWIPWDPDAYKTGRVEFMEDELNQLHHEKLKNETKAKEEFDRRVLETKRKQKCVFTLSSSFWKMFLQLRLSLITLSSATPIHLFAKRLGGAMEVNVEAIIGKCFLYLETAHILSNFVRVRVRVRCIRSSLIILK